MNFRKLFKRTERAGSLFITLMLIMFSASAAAQDGKLKGNVTGASDGEPLIGVSVVVKGTSKGSVTDYDGNYALNGLKRGDIVVFSYIGYTAAEQTYNGQQTMDIKLKEDSRTLDDVVVIGYGTMKKKLVTGATMQLKGDDIQKLNTVNPLSAMQGQTPGVNIVSTSGQPGASMSVTIRGLGTVGNSQPLYLIDGIAGDITNLNPADIERIDVLKDAASAAIYGAQAANGVILVTTKSGKEGTSKISYDGYVGWQTVGRKFDMLNSREYMSIMDEARLNSGMSPVDWASLNSIHDANGNIYDTDWIDNAIDDGALTTSHNLSFAGGSKTSTYVISGGYTGQDGVIGGKDVSYYKRYNFRANSEHKMYDGLITVGEHVSFVWKDSRNMGTGNIYNNNLRSAFSASPIMPVYGPDGGYYDTTGSDWNVNDGNPYGTMMVNRYNRSRSGNLDANAYMQVEPIKNLKFKTVFAVGYGASDYRSYTPAYSFSPQSGQTEESVRQSNGHGLSMVWTNTLSYDFTLKGGHDISALVGTEWSKYDGSSTEGYNTGIVPGFDDWDHAWLTNTNGTANKSAKGAPYDPVRSMSYFARLGWSWKDRYMVNATLRADGSSKFAPGNRWGYFPSVSAAWRISHEKFMQGSSAWLDNLKLRASYGSLGNNATTSYYMYRSLFATAGYVLNGSIAGGFAQAVLSNPNLSWEKTCMANIGLDASLFNSRLSASFDIYRKLTKGILISLPAPLEHGTSTVPNQNAGEVCNKGLEVDLQWADRIGSVSYHAGFNMGFVSNKVTRFQGDVASINGVYKTQEGHPIDQLYVITVDRIVRDQADLDYVQSLVDANPDYFATYQRPELGDFLFADTNHDGKLDADDRVEIGHGATPRLTYGISLGASWRGIDFSALFQGVGDHSVYYNNQAFRFVTVMGQSLVKDITDNAWTPENPYNSIYPILRNNANGKNNIASDAFIQNAAYFRCKNIQLGYTVPQSVSRRFFVENLRVYTSIDNLFTITSFPGFDPEIGANVGYPAIRQYSVGINISF